MLKLVTYDLVDHLGSHVEIINGPFDTFTKKAASFEGEYSPEILGAIEALNTKPAHTYLLINALGAGEYYGSNKNNDYFPERALIEYHKTFEALAHVFKHHQNSDPNRSYGKVLFSFYNPKMHRVELIVELSNEKAPDIIQRIVNGDHVSTSMGCRVPYDVCSECGNKAKNRGEYCSHLQRGVAGHITESGRRPYAINLQPKFFDISFVTIPADATSSVMAKVASIINPGVTSESDMDRVIKISGLKKADLIKRIDGEIEQASPSVGELVVKLQPPMLKKELLDITSRYKLSEILSTLLAMYIMPKREDFQRLVLYSTGRQKLADYLDETGQVFSVDPDVSPIIPSDICPLRMNTKLAEEYSHWIKERSLTKPLIVTRLLEKVAKDGDPPPKGGGGNGKTSPSSFTGPPTLSANGQMIAYPTTSMNDRRARKSNSSLRKNYSTNFSTSKEELGKISQYLMKRAAAGQFPDPARAGATRMEEEGRLPNNPAPVMKNPFFAITGLGALYVGYQRLMNMGNASNLPKMERTIIQNPWMLPLLAGAAGYLAVAGQKKTAGYVDPNSIRRFKDPGVLKSILVATLPTYYYSGRQELKRQQGEQLDSVQEFVRKHPFITSLGALAGVRAGINQFTKRATVEDIIAEMPEDMLEDIYQKIIE